MTDMRVTSARIIAGLSLLVGGGTVQVLLWRKHGEAWFNALGRHGYLWLVYFLLAMMVGEHSLKWIKRKTP